MAANSYLVLGAGVSAVVPFHRHAHFGGAVVRKPGVRYTPLAHAEWAAIQRFSVVAQVNGGVAEFMYACDEPSAGLALLLTEGQKKYLTKIGLLHANANDLKGRDSGVAASTLERLPINGPPGVRMTDKQLEKVKEAIETLKASWEAFEAM